MNRKQRETIALIQTGTFLEYFDLMLYVHMAVLLNELFYPQTDPHTGRLLASFSFCSVYVLRPLGAFVFGYIGDVIGRKCAVILSTLLMGFTCICMFALPTYEEIGIMASVGITMCRALQGVAAQGEIIGAEIYIVETVLPPARYVLTSLTSFFLRSAELPLWFYTRWLNCMRPIGALCFCLALSLPWWAPGLMKRCLNEPFVSGHICAIIGS